MGVLEDIRTYLIGQALGTADNVKMSQLTDAPDEQIALMMYDAGGGLELMTMRPDLPVITPRLQVKVRHTTYTLAETKAFAVFNNMITVREVNLPPSNKRYIVFQPINTPALLDRDDQNRSTFVFNLMIPKEQ